MTGPNAAACLVLAAALAALPACEKEQPGATPPPAPTPAANTPDDHGHGHGPAVELGSATIGSFEVTAARDEGPIVAGGDAPIDVTVVPAAGSTAKVAAVRFWIGIEDAQGSVKARAEIEDPAEPTRWHTHAEIPSPLPEGSMLWIEIESEAGETVVGSVDLKA